RSRPRTAGLPASPAHYRRYKKKPRRGAGVAVPRRGALLRQGGMRFGPAKDGWHALFQFGSGTRVREIGRHRNFEIDRAVQPGCAQGALERRLLLRRVELDEAGHVSSALVVRELHGVDPPEGLADRDERLRELAEVLRVAQLLKNVGIHARMLRDRARGPLSHIADLAVVVRRRRVAISLQSS